MANLTSALVSPYANPGALLDAKGKDTPLLFTPLKIRGVTFKNRAWIPPLCQYSCESGTGVPNAYHLVHQGSFSLHGAACVFTEASAVLPNGRISPEDVGIWSHDQISGHKMLTDFHKSQGAIPAIQIAHAGRKACTYSPWKMDGFVDEPVEASKTSRVVPPEQGGFEKNVFAPSAIAFDEQHAKPAEISDQDIVTLKEAYVDAAKRSVAAGYEVIEIHGAHGYLFHEFCSPISNKRTDRYGGSFDNRTRLPIELAKLVRSVIPETMPLFYRVSATDWYDKGEFDEAGNAISWGIEQTAQLAALLGQAGVDLIDVSSAGNYAQQKIKIGPGYQVPFASALKKNSSLKNLKIAAVGLITSSTQAEEILQKEEADAIFFGREAMRDANFVENAAYALGVTIRTAKQYERAHTRMYAKN